MFIPTSISKKQPKSRGFGFVTFESDLSAQAAVDQHYVLYCGKQASCLVYMYLTTLV